jgi:hypothetical protein
MPKRQELGDGQAMKRYWYEVLVKGLLAGTLMGAAHLLTVTYLKKKFY